MLVSFTWKGKEIYKKSVGFVLSILLMFFVILAGVFFFVLKWSIVLIGILLIIKIIAFITGHDSIGSLIDCIIGWFKQT